MSCILYIHFGIKLNSKYNYSYTSTHIALKISQPKDIYTIMTVYTCMNDLELTEDEIEIVNKIIEGIQKDLNFAIEELKSGNWDKALKSIQDSITKSNCPVCKRELGILNADVVHNKQICLLKSDECENEKEVVISKAIELKEDFVPVIQTKKAIKDKAKSVSSTKPSQKLNIPMIPAPYLPRFKDLFSSKKSKRN